MQDLSFSAFWDSAGQRCLSQMLCCELFCHKELPGLSFVLSLPGGEGAASLPKHQGPCSPTLAPAPGEFC